MSTIDERIVSIKFNNSQFEAGIKTTLSSLDGLKNSLNFSAGVKALGDLDAAGKKVNLKFDTNTLDAGVKSTVDSAKKLKQELKFDGAVKSLGDLDAAGKKVNLKLDPTTFQSGAKAVVDAATNIKQNLNFDSVQRSIGNLKMSAQNFSFQNVVNGAQTVRQSIADMDLATKAVSFLPITNGAENAKSSISAMSIAGIAAIGAIGVKAAMVGADMARSLFLDPAKSGLAEYETNLGSIQTIMANTQWENKTLGDVNGALDELNHYSDKTIYNFAEMAKNIGTFTSAGVSLDDSTAAIKGIANLAAVSGSNSQQASTAMYQLSQAMSAGKVGLEDWNSVVNAGMGGKVFQDALIQTAKNQGQNVDGLIAKHGSFRMSLQEGWVTTKVMNETLSKMTGDLTDEQLRAMGYNDEQIVGIQEMARTAQDAATKIKTFTQLTGTLQEITGSGWAQSWKLILGDFEQAKEMWTSVYGVIGSMVQGSADARNKVLGDWNALGGRTVMIEAISNAFKALMGILKPVQDAFRSVFPPMTGQRLYDITVGIRNLTAAMMPSQETANFIGQAFKLLFTIIKIGLSIITGAISVVVAFFKAFATGGDSIKGSLQPVTDMLAKLTERIQNSKFIENFFKGLATVATTMGSALGRVIPIVLQFAIAIFDMASFISGAAMPFISKFASFISGQLVGALSSGIDVFFALVSVIGIFVSSLDEGVDVAMTRVRERIESLQRMGDAISEGWKKAGEVVNQIWQKMLPVREAIAKMFQDIKDNIKNALTDVSFEESLDLVNTGLLAGLVLLFRNFFKKLTGMGDGMKDSLMKHLETSVESINGVLEALTGTLGAMQQNLQADTLMKIAIAIGILTISVVALSMINSGDLTKALIGIGVMVVILGKAMEALDKITIGSGFIKLPFIAASMILLATALTILSIPVMLLSRLSWGELIKGLFGVAVLLAALAKTTEAMAKNPANLIATGIGLMAVAVAIKILASAVTDIAALSFGGMIQGLIGVAGLLTALSIFNNMTKVNAGSMASAAGLILLGIALKIMASAMADFAAMNLGGLVQGLATLGIVLLILNNFSKSVGDGGNMIKTAIAIGIMGYAMKVMADAIGALGSLNFGVAAQGLIVMAVALKVITMAMNGVNEKDIIVKAAAFVVIAAALLILSQALQSMGGMSWEEIGKGLVTLGGAMLILAIGMNMMTGALAGAAALFVVAAGLAILAPVLVQLGNLSWEQIGMGMAALAAVFIIFGLAGLIMAPIVPVIFALGTAIAMLGLGLLATGIGVAAFAAGLAIIATVVTATGPALIAFVASILALIPLALQKLAEGIVEFAKVIGGAVPIFVEAFTILLLALLECIIAVTPKIGETLWALIVMLVELLVRALPLFVDAGMKIIVGILEGIANNIGKLIDAAAKIITEFIDGIARGLPKIIESGVNLVVSFIEGMATSVKNNSTRMANAGADLAEAIVNGMVNGLATMGGRVLTSIGDMANSALNEAKRILGIHSPSREFFAVGKYTGLGWANGTKEYGGRVVSAVGDIGSSALDTLKQSMSNISQLVSATDMNMNPTIRPVLDLSSVKKEAGNIDGMLSPSLMNLSGTYGKATVLSKTAEANREAKAEMFVNSTDPKEPAQVTYNQYNTSPKALSEIDIYRRTNNQISTLKGVVIDNDRIRIP